MARPTRAPSPLRQAHSQRQLGPDSSAVWSEATKTNGAERGTRTPTTLSGLRILSPLRLPIPPSRHVHCLYSMSFSIANRRVHGHGNLFLHRPNHYIIRSPAGKFCLNERALNPPDAAICRDQKAASQCPALLPPGRLLRAVF